MSSTVRKIVGVVLLLLAGGCAYLAVAAREAPADARVAHWTLYGAAGVACLVAAAWLLRPNRSWA
jgi:hypothetical protein